jgi:hypothetical protein
MLMNDYVVHKLRELDAERLSPIAARAEEAAHLEGPKAKPVVGHALRFAGRTLRRVGTGLEHWADPQAQEPELRLEDRVGSPPPAARG